MVIYKVLHKEFCSQNIERIFSHLFNHLPLEIFFSNQVFFRQKERFFLQSECEGLLKQSKIKVILFHISFCIKILTFYDFLRSKNAEETIIKLTSYTNTFILSYLQLRNLSMQHSLNSDDFQKIFL